MTFDHENGDKSILEEKKFTEKQGQYLAYIYYYIKINGQSAAETDMQRYFNVSPPSVHRMIVELEKKNLIERTKRKARSLKNHDTTRAITSIDLSTQTIFFLWKGY